ncbi:MAG TPA: 3-dehydroquinate synthase [Deltaproteobacteria bacterium]|nr:MAG: 3-dehydroquinate synthase [Deltaproteobacteria bacterium]HDM77010.1 3-dehydroquinate synthase [Deltaproteobacteria bacterium]
MTRVEVSLKKLEDRSYTIHIGYKCLDRLCEILSEIPLNSVFVITDRNVEKLWAGKIIALLEKRFPYRGLISVEPGEEQKNLLTIEKLARKLVSMKADRASTIIAVGGGVIGDIAGFLASIFLRGVSFINIPTTLLAQVDSSVGGKTGVDLPEGKNLVGTFYQPVLVFADVDFLSTLPHEEFLNGMSEVIKYGIIMDTEFFTFLESNVEKILEKEPDILIKIVSQSCKLKREIVEKDEKEAGLRRILNFGHTIGHSIEAASNYRIKHGWAVSMGMVAASYLALEYGMTEPEEVKRIENLIDRFGLPVCVPEDLTADEIVQGLTYDKKMVDSKLRWILPTKIGSVNVVEGIKTDDVINVLRRLKGR